MSRGHLGVKTTGFHSWLISDFLGDFQLKSCNVLSSFLISKIEVTVPLLPLLYRVQSTLIKKSDVEKFVLLYIFCYFFFAKFCQCMCLPLLKTKQRAVYTGFYLLINRKHEVTTWTAGCILFLYYFSKSIDVINTCG